ncbi:hypothetical protein [Alteraurantiacibacter aquimixticola]|uniref:Rap1a immunity protein domain-containing protein n=1 Tax=Alteraurantiacibacter aquimixticola TaxID=2489173 RepID=A0A4T3F0A5_9SPHN|nr:hypothetical protein [Alteraurantiacibacter aquimixticola]TIX50354.1 hypothetical protein E5222_08730 [Alteraurantiacibacter aquimixticola]
MKKRIILPLGLLLSCGMPENVIAQGGDGANETFNYVGFPGNDSCGNWIEARANPQRHGQTLEGWLLGYITGHNAFHRGYGRLGQSTNATGMLAWIDGYCEENPLDSLLMAANALIVELMDREGNSQ